MFQWATARTYGSRGFVCVLKNYFSDEKNNLIGLFLDSEMREIRIQQEREERSLVADYLEQEKHLLRQLQG